MFKKANTITSIISLSLFSLFTVFVGYVYRVQAQIDSSEIVALGDGAYGWDFHFKAKTVFFIIAAAILILALISHVLKLIMRKKLVLPILCAALSVASLAFFYVLSTELVIFMFFRIILHIDISNIALLKAVKPTVVIVLLISELTALVFSVLHHINKNNASSVQ